MNIIQEKDQFLREYRNAKNHFEHGRDGAETTKRIELMHRFIGTLKNLMLTSTLPRDLRKAGWTKREIISFFLKGSDIDQGKLYETRQFLGFDKWMPLETIVSFVDVIKKDQDGTLRNKYDDYLRYSVPNRDLRRKLTEEHSVNIKDLAGIIRHQSEEQNRSIVEIVSNACDYSLENGLVEVTISENGYTVQDHGLGMTPTQIFERLLIPKSSGSVAERDDTIGRFGMGFYTALSHLNHEDDTLSVETSDANQGYEVTFQMRKGKIQVKTTARNDIESGTTVRLQSQDFESADAERMLREYMSYNRHAQIELNGQRINDTSNLRRIGEHILVGDQEETSSKACVVTVCVHGVKIEGLIVEGSNLPQELVLDLSKSMQFAENRSEISIDDRFIKEMKTLINLISQDDNPIPMLNALYPLIADLQGRNRVKTRGGNLLLYLHEKAIEVLPKNKPLVPNTVGFEMVHVPNAEYVHPGYHRFNYAELPGFERCKQFKSNTHVIYLVDFVSEVEQVAVEIEEHKVFLLNRKIFERHRDNPALLNLYFNVGRDNPIGAFSIPRPTYRARSMLTRKVNTELSKNMELSPVPESMLQAYYRRFRKYGDLSPIGYQNIVFDRSFYDYINYGKEYRIRDYIFGESNAHLIPAEEYNPKVETRLEQAKDYYSWFTEDNFRQLSRQTPKEREKAFIVFLRDYLSQNPTVLKEYRNYRTNELLSTEENIDRIIKRLTNTEYNGYSISMADRLSILREVLTLDPDSYIRTVSKYLEYLDRLDQQRKVPVEYQPIFEIVFSHQKELWISDYNYYDKYEQFAGLCRKNFPLVNQYIQNVIQPALGNILLRPNELFWQLNTLINVDPQDLVDAEERLANLKKRQTEMNACGLSESKFMNDEEMIMQEIYEQAMMKQKDPTKFGRSRRRFNYEKAISEKESEIAKLKLLLPGIVSMRENSTNFHHNLVAFLQIPTLVELSTKVKADIEEGLISSVDNISCMEVERQVGQVDYEQESVFYQFPVYTGKRFSQQRLNQIDSTLKLHYDLDLIDKVHRKRLEKYLQYCWKALGTSDAAFSRLNEVLGSMQDMELGDAVFKHNFLEETMLEIGHYNDHIIADFLQFYSGVSEKVFDSEDLVHLRKKCITMWQHIAQKAPENYSRIVNQLSGRIEHSFRHDYKYFNDDSIPARNVPRNIRAYVLYMRTSEAELLNRRPASYFDISLDSYDGQSRLSELSIVKSLNQKKLIHFEANPTALSAYVSEQAKGKDHELAQREIRHAMQYLSVNDGYLFIRELINNSIDAIKRETQQSITADGKQRKISKWISKAMRGFAKSSGSEIAVDDNSKDVYIEHFLKPISQEEFMRQFKQAIDQTITPDMYLTEDAGEKLSEYFNAISEKLSEHELIDATELRDNFMMYLKLLGGSVISSQGLKELDLKIATMRLNRMVVVAQDHIGMSFQEVMNHLLVPGEKASTKGSRFGQKFFTVLQNAEVVLLKTGTGNNQVTYCRLIPVTNGNDEIVDVHVEYDVRREEGFKGTVIQKIVNSDFPELEAALLKDATITFGSLVDANSIVIDYAGSPINQPRDVIASANVGNLGLMRLYDVPENALTQNGIFVRELDDEYWVKVPGHVKETLTREGLVIDLPPGIELIVSGNNLARKQQILPELQQIIPLLAMQAYLVKFQQGSILLEDLPYDYFSQQDGTAAVYERRKISAEIRKDAERIRKGEVLEDYAKYFDRDTFIKLITLIPSITVGNERLSLFEVAERSARGEDLDLPPKIKSLVNKSREFKESIAAQEEAFIESGQKQITDFIPVINEEVKGKAGVYIAFVGMTDTIMERIHGHDIRLGLYLKPDGSVAHATRAYFINLQETFPLISWNMLALDPYLGFIQRLLESDSNITEAEKQKFYYDFFNTVTHERQHINEGTSWTHNAQFYQGQRDFISQLLQNERFSLTQFETAFLERGYKPTIVDAAEFVSMTKNT